MLLKPYKMNISISDLTVRTDKYKGIEISENGKLLCFFNEKGKTELAKFIMDSSSSFDHIKRINEDVSNEILNQVIINR